MPNLPRLVPLDGNGSPILHMLGKVSKVASRVDKILYVPLCLGKNLASVERFDLREDVEAFFHFISQAMQQRTAFVDRHSCPGRLTKRCCAGVDRRVHVSSLHFMDFSQRLAGARVVGRKGRTARGCHFPAANHRLVGPAG